MMNYFITKYYENHNDYCLECICGTNEQHAKEVLTKMQKEDPKGEYRIEAEEWDKCWWNQGALD